MSTKVTRRRLLATGLIGGGALSLLPAGTLFAQGKGKGKHPHIHKALHHLREAKKQLEEAAHDYDGHRSAAVAAAKAGIAECEQALKHRT